MKIKNVILAFSSMFLLAGCDEADVERALTQFKDENIRAIVGVSDAKKQEIRDSVKNYAFRSYFSMNANITENFGEREEHFNYNYSDYFSEDELTEVDFFSFEENYWRFACLGYQGIIKKENGEYITSGSYFDFISSTINYIDFGALYETHAEDSIFSFGLLDRLNAVINYESSVSSNAGMNLTVENKEWYKAAECYDKVDEGTFKIHITEPIVMRVSGAKLSYDTIELVFENYLLQSQLVVISVEAEYQSSQYGAELKLTEAASSVFSYNVDPEVLFA